MENRKLNTSDGWEDIVIGNYIKRASARERVAAWKRAYRLRKMLMATCVTAMACISTVILGAAGAMTGWLAAMVAIVCLVASSVLFGRYVEVKKR